MSPQHSQELWMLSRSWKSNVSLPCRIMSFDSSSRATAAPMALCPLRYKTNASTSFGDGIETFSAGASSSPMKNELRRRDVDLIFPSLSSDHQAEIAAKEAPVVESAPVEAEPKSEETAS